MGTVILSMSHSLDGCITGPDRDDRQVELVASRHRVLRAGAGA